MFTVWCTDASAQISVKGGSNIDQLFLWSGRQCFHWLMGTLVPSTVIWSYRFYMWNISLAGHNYTLGPGQRRIYFRKYNDNDLLLVLWLHMNVISPHRESTLVAAKTRPAITGKNALGVLRVII